MSRVLFSFEVPINHLEEFDEYQDFYFTLAQMFKDKRYKEFYMTSRKPVWLDNGANEQGYPCSVMELAVLLHEGDFTHFLLPDFPDLWSNPATKALASELMRMYRREYSSIWLYNATPVPVCYDETDIVESVGLGYRTIALPYDVDRSRLLEFVKGKDVYVHLLGYRQAGELEHPNVVSIDTSFPIKLAMGGIPWNPSMARDPKGLKTTNNYFYQTLTPEQVKLAIKNIQAMKDYAYSIT